MISTYKFFFCLIPHKKKEKSHFKLGADVTQIKKAFEMLLISPGLDTSSLKWSTFTAENFQCFLQLHFPDAKVKWSDEGTSFLWLTIIFAQQIKINKQKSLRRASQVGKSCSQTYPEFSVGSNQEMSLHRHLNSRLKYKLLGLHLPIVYETIIW